eukprot:10882114-Heterocapsa_arctica.AAC.1
MVEHNVLAATAAGLVVICRVPISKGCVVDYMYVRASRRTWSPCISRMGTAYGTVSDEIVKATLPGEVR